MKKVAGLIADLAIKGPGGKGKGWKNREESFGAWSLPIFDPLPN